MISHKYKCIFIHQRKCAGTSIIQSFGMTTEDPDWHFMNNGCLSPEALEAPDDYFKFAVVRNPWDRFVSGWQYCDSTKGRGLIDVLKDLPTCGHDYEHLTRNQRDTLFNTYGVMVVDYVMRFENLQRDYDTVCDIIGKPHMKLPLVNNIPGRQSYRECFVGMETRRLFMEQFGRDIRTFGYEY